MIALFSVCLEKFPDWALACPLACPHLPCWVSLHCTVGNDPGQICLSTVSHRKKSHPWGRDPIWFSHLDGPCSLQGTWQGMWGVICEWILKSNMLMCPWPLLFPTPVDTPCPEHSRHNDLGRVVTAVTACYCHRGPSLTWPHRTPTAPTSLEPTGHRSSISACRGAFWRAGGEGLAGVTPVTISVTYLPPPLPSPLTTAGVN